MSPLAVKNKWNVLYKALDMHSTKVISNYNWSINIIKWINFITFCEQRLVFLASQYHFKVWGPLYRGMLALTKFRGTLFQTQLKWRPMAFHGNTEGDATIQLGGFKNKWHWSGFSSQSLCVILYLIRHWVVPLPGLRINSDTSAPLRCLQPS